MVFTFSRGAARLARLPSSFRTKRVIKPNVQIAFALSPASSSSLETAMPAAAYIDPRNGKLYPLDQPRWCSDERTPLLVTPGAGMSREDIDRRARSLWRYRAALPVAIAKPITLGEG